MRFRLSVGFWAACALAACSNPPTGQASFTIPPKLAPDDEPALPASGSATKARPEPSEAPPKDDASGGLAKGDVVQIYGAADPDLHAQHLACISDDPDLAEVRELIEPENFGAFRDHSVGEVVTGTVPCGSEQLVVVLVDEAWIAVPTPRLSVLPRACLQARQILFERMLEAWQPCLGLVPHQHRLSDLAVVFLTLALDGSVADVAWRGGTGWGRKPVLCMLDAAEALSAEGISAEELGCGGATLRVGRTIEGSEFPP